MCIETGAARAATLSILFVGACYVFLLGGLVEFSGKAVRGASDGKYPYPFMDIPKVGWASAFTTVAIILVAYLLVAVFVWLGRLLDSTQKNA